MPLVAVYTGEQDAPSKGSPSRSRYELAAFNIRVKLVEPGYGPSTRFTGNGGRACRV